MGIQKRPVGKFESVMRKLQNELDKKKSKTKNRSKSKE